VFDSISGSPQKVAKVFGVSKIQQTTRSILPRTKLPKTPRFQTKGILANEIYVVKRHFFLNQTRFNSNAGIPPPKQTFSRAEEKRENERDSSTRASLLTLMSNKIDAQQLSSETRETDERERERERGGGQKHRTIRKLSGSHARVACTSIVGWIAGRSSGERRMSAASPSDEIRRSLSRGRGGGRQAGRHPRGVLGDVFARSGSDERNGRLRPR